MTMKSMVMYAELFHNLSFKRPENVRHLCPIKTKINFFFVLLIPNFTKPNFFLNK